MLVIQKSDLAINLLAYGEEAASAKVQHLSPEEYRRVCEIGHRHAMTGMLWLKAGCLAVIEVLEGRPRELKRKRRVWSSTEGHVFEPDPIIVEVMERINRYAGGQNVNKKNILDSISDALAKELAEFRYYRKRTQFRKDFADGTSYLYIDVSRGDVALRFGVTHDRIEETRARLFNCEWKPSKDFADTISKYSVNMGPGSWHWPYPTEATWPISGSDGLELATNEIVAFVKDVVSPYLLSHQNPAAIRETILSTPGHVDLTPGGLERTVFAVDRLLGKRDWLDQDFKQFRANSDTEGPRRPPQWLVDRTAKDYEHVVATWDN